VHLCWRDSRPETKRSELASRPNFPRLSGQVTGTLTAKSQVAGAEQATRLTLRPCPYPIEDSPICVYWHDRYHKGSANMWFRNLILSTCSSPPKVRGLSRIAARETPRCCPWGGPADVRHLCSQPGGDNCRSASIIVRAFGRPNENVGLACGKCQHGWSIALYKFDVYEGWTPSGFGGRTPTSGGLAQKGTGR